MGEKADEKDDDVDDAADDGEAGSDMGRTGRKKGRRTTQGHCQLAHGLGEAKALLEPVLARR